MPPKRFGGTLALLVKAEKGTDVLVLGDGPDYVARIIP
jgi:hypothetical protein